MGDIERAKAALLDAHAAGDTDSAQQLADYIRANEPERSWSNVAGSAIQNLIPSTGRVIGDIAETVMHPIDTAKNIGKLGYGAIQNALPESVVNAIGADKESQDMASNVGQFYKDRYGSMEGFKEALATDPAGILMDAGSAFTGGGAAISKIPTLS